jgi:hypothetical protein
MTGKNQRLLSPSESGRVVRVDVDPGICGFGCSIQATKREKGSVEISIQSECNQVSIMADSLPKINIKELFLPLSQSPVFQIAERSKCHSSCPIPFSVLKTAEVALGLALPKNVTLRFNG